MGKTNEGKQLSDEWIEKRIIKVVDEDTASKIMIELRKKSNNVEKIVSKVNEKGEVFNYCVDSLGNVIKNADGSHKILKLVN